MNGKNYIISSLGMCAERNALSSMLTSGEHEVERVMSFYKDGTIMPPWWGMFDKKSELKKEC